jgi:hypothetical protein
LQPLDSDQKKERVTKKQALKFLFADSDMVDRNPARTLATSSARPAVAHRLLARIPTQPS